MKARLYILSQVDDNKVVKIIKVLFGIICIAVALFWLYFNLNSIKTDGTLWITIFFLTGFGLYQIGSGLGKTTRYIDIREDSVLLRKYPALPAVNIKAAETEKIELFPLSIVFFLRSGKKMILRFGTTYVEINNEIKEDILEYTEKNNIPVELIREEI